jgi:hypothetical protein
MEIYCSECTQKMKTQLKILASVKEIEKKHNLDKKKRF